MTKRQKRWQRSQTFSGKVEEFVKGTKLVQMVGRLALWPRLRSGQASYYFLWPWILFICGCLWAHSRGQTLSVPSSVSGQNTLPLMASPLFQWPGSPKAHKPPVGQAFGSHLRNGSPRGGAGGRCREQALCACGEGFSRGSIIPHLVLSLYQSLSWMLGGARTGGAGEAGGAGGEQGSRRGQARG